MDKHYLIASILIAALGAFVIAAGVENLILIPLGTSNNTRMLIGPIIGFLWGFFIAPPLAKKLLRIKK